MESHIPVQDEKKEGSEGLLSQTKPPKAELACLGSVQPHMKAMHLNLFYP